MLAQLIPLTPVIDQVPVPVGTAPPVGPVTVAVKVKLPPRATLAAEVVTTTVGVTWLMVKLKAADGPAVV